MRGRDVRRADEAHHRHTSGNRRLDASRTVLDRDAALPWNSKGGDGTQIHLGRRFRCADHLSRENPAAHTLFQASAAYRVEHAGAGAVGYDCRGQIDRLDGRLDAVNRGGGCGNEMLYPGKELVPEACGERNGKALLQEIENLRGALAKRPAQHRRHFVPRRQLAQRSDERAFCDDFAVDNDSVAIADERFNRSIRHELRIVRPGL